MLIGAFAAAVGIGAVRYREEGAAAGPNVASEAEPRSQHRVRISGLSRGARYRYQVLHEGEPVAEEFGFRTSPGREGTVRLAAIGDSGSGDEHQRAIASVIRGLSPDLLLHAGDLVYTGGLDRAIFEPYREILSRTCMYAVPGNHDNFYVFRDLFPPPEENPEHTGTYYAFDWACAHFVGLDTNRELAEDSVQVRWLVSHLEAIAAEQPSWLILFLHEPPFTVGDYSRSHRESRSTVPPIADRFGIDLVIGAHDRNYQRMHPVREGTVRDAWQNPRFVLPRGTLYVVTGGGGGWLYPRESDAPDAPFVERFLQKYHALDIGISPEELSVRVLGEGGEQLDALQITKSGPRPEFRLLRGDVDFNGRLEITDPVALLGHLFLGAPAPCPAAGNASGSGEAPNIAESVYLLNYLFLGGPPPASPYPECGPIPLEEDAWCTRAGCAE